MKTIYKSVTWDEYNSCLKNEGWLFNNNENKFYTSETLIRISKEIPTNISLGEPYTRYINHLTQDSIRWLLSPISDPEGLGGPFYDYYCLLTLKYTCKTWEESNEYPYILWCYGNDDFTWYKFIKELHEGHEVMDYLEIETHMPSLYEFLKAFEFKS